MSFKEHLSQAYNASIGLESAGKTNLFEGLSNSHHSGVRATVDNFNAYISDIIRPGFQTGKNLLNIINPYSVARNGILGHLKSPFAALTQGLTTVKNAGLGLGTGVRHLYRYGIQTPGQHLLNGTTGNIPYVGAAVKHVSDTVLSIIGAPLAAFDWGARKFDNGIDHLNDITMLKGQTLHKSRMREGTVAGNGLHNYATD